jgi:hypothetical protein
MPDVMRSGGEMVTSRAMNRVVLAVWWLWIVGIHMLALCALISVAFRF